MKPIDVQPILDAALHTVNQCRLDGATGRFKSHSSAGNQEDPWTSAAAVNVLYGLNILPGRNHDRQEWIDTLQSYQDESSGLFKTPHSKNDLLLTAACTAALSCFDCAPLHPPTELLIHTEPGNLYSFCRELKWCQDPERAARELGALFTSLVLTSQVGAEWETQYFNWIRKEVDEHTGLLRRECLAPVELDGHWTLLPYLCAYLYPLTTSLYARQPQPLPWRMIDTALEIMEYHRNLFFQPKGQRHLPWVFALTRSRFRSAHRFEEAQHALERFIPPYLDFLNDQIRSNRFNSPTHIQWDIALLAELQIALPGSLLSRRPLRQILDHHPFL
jgi:hypothetical protein